MITAARAYERNDRIWTPRQPPNRPQARMEVEWREGPVNSNIATHGGGLSPAQMAHLLTHQKEARRLMDKLDAEDSLLHFIRVFWHVLEPGRKLATGKPLEVLCEHLEAVSRGQIRKIIINVPPGCMKSLLTCVFWPAWEWLKRPHLRYIASSYADHLSKRDNGGRDGRLSKLLNSAIFQEYYGDRFAIVADKEVKISNDKSGWKFATSVKGVGTGERADRFIMDDLHSVKKAESEADREGVLQYATEVVTTRRNDQYTVFLVIMQRVHDRDVSGLFLAQDLGYELVCLPMRYEPDHPWASLARSSIGWRDWRTTPGELLWPERYPLAEVEDMEKGMSAWGGSYAVAGQFQQRPHPRGGGMFKKEWFEIITELQPGEFVVRSARGWDLASSTALGAAWTVGVRLGMTSLGRVLVEDVVRERGTPLAVKSLIETTAKMDGPSVRQSLPKDPGQAGDAQRDDMMRTILHGLDAHFSPETGDKEVRAAPFAAQAEAKNVILMSAVWNLAYLAEAESFPAGQFKDQIDASSRAYHTLITMPTVEVPIGPTIIKMK